MKKLRYTTRVINEVRNLTMPTVDRLLTMARSCRKFFLPTKHSGYPLDSGCHFLPFTYSLWWVWSTVVAVTAPVSPTASFNSKITGQWYAGEISYQQVSVLKNISIQWSFVWKLYLRASCVSATGTSSPCVEIITVKIEIWNTVLLFPGYCSHGFGQRSDALILPGC